MDELLINNWNSLIQKTDQVWHLGDFGYKLKGEADGTPDKLSALNSIFNRLNGDKHLIMGNHDITNKVNKLKWSSVHDTKMLNYEGNQLWLSHYAHRTWPSKHHGSFHLFGHSHGKLPGFERSMDVGVDADQYKEKYKPISIEQVISQLKPIHYENTEELNKVRG